MGAIQRTESMRLIILLLALQLAVTNLSLGQWTDNSYAVLVSKDTLKGIIKYQGGSKVFVKKSEQDKSVKLTPEDVEFFKVGPDFYYSVEYVDLNSNTMYSKAFMLLKVNGFIKLFTYKTASYASVSPTGTGGYFTSSAAYYITVGEDRQFIAISRGDQLLRYVNDHSELASRVKNKNYNGNEIEAIITEYNEWKKTN